MTALFAIYHLNAVFLRRILPHPFKAACIRMILWYQKHLSAHTCMFRPTCSQYTLESINNLGVIFGIVLGFFRILRCNPFTKPGTFDPAPEKFYRLKWLI